MAGLGSNLRYTEEEKKEKVLEITALIDAGLNPFDACKKVGVSKTSYWSWRKGMGSKRPKRKSYTRHSTIVLPQKNVPLNAIKALLSSAVELLNEL